MLNKTQLNLGLAFVLVVLSLLSIYWHHQMYLLFKQDRQVQNTTTQLIALNKQLLTDKSQRISGAQIKHKAIDELGMRPVKKLEYRDISL